MQQSNDSIERALQGWRGGRASLEEIRALSREIASAHYDPGIPALTQLLNHEDEIVRYNAVVALGFDFGYRPATERLLEMLANDNDVDCRDAAAGSLRMLWENSKNPRVLKALGHAALCDWDDDVRKAAYMALVVVNGLPREEYLQLLTHKRLPVDEREVKAILSTISE